MSKPKVLIAVLTGAERSNWVNPDLTLTLVRMVKDPRFDVNYFPVRDARPWETARNITIVAARQINADWLISFDNDNFVPEPANPLDIIATAGKEHHIVGLTYGVPTDNHSYRLFPGEPRANSGPFKEADFVGCGVLMVRNTVWQRVPNGPWFRWQHADNADNEVLSPDKGAVGEDVYFCRLARQHGLKIWTHAQLAAHYRTVEVTSLALTLSTLSNVASTVKVDGQGAASRLLRKIGLR